MPFLLFLVTFIGIIFPSYNVVPETPAFTETGSYQTTDYQFHYGHVTYQSGEIDGFLTIYHNGQIVSDILYDDGESEFFSYVAQISSERIFVVCEQYYRSEGLTLPTFRKTTIIEYDFSGDLIREHHSSTKYRYFHNHSFVLVLIDYNNTTTYWSEEGVETSELILPNEYQGEFHLQYQGEAYINGEAYQGAINQPGNYCIEIIDGNYRYEYDIMIHPIVSLQGETSGTYYIGPVVIDTSGIIYVNGESYVSEETLSNPGTYQVAIYGVNDYVYQMTFTILPTLYYFDGADNIVLTDDITVDIPIKIFSNSQSMELNGEAYQSDWITDSKTHQLVVYGLNNFRYRITITLLPYVVGVTDQGVYETVAFTVYGTAEINGNAVEGDVEIIDPGEYTLKLFFDDEIYQEYRFTVVDNSIETTESLLNQSWINYVLILVIGIGGYYILRKK